MCYFAGHAGSHTTFCIMSTQHLKTVLLKAECGVSLNGSTIVLLLNNYCQDARVI